MTLQQDAQQWTIRDLMKFSINYLQRHGFDEARLTVELLLSHALHCQRIELYTHFEKPLSKEELKSFRSCFERRLAHEPVQYIVGTTMFMGLQFRVDTRVLIPRPETETLVEQVMMICGHRTLRQDLSILEIGTGSGNIAVSLAKLVRNIRVTTMDVSADALTLARENATANNVGDAITFLQGDILTASAQELQGPYDVVVSNPPYVSIDEWSKLDPVVRQFEPQMAVSDNGDGYRFYHCLANLGPRILRQSGSMVVEVGMGQADEVCGLFEKHGFTDLQVARDLQEIPRIVSARWFGQTGN